MMRFFLTLLFFLAILLLPWYTAVLVGVVLIAFFEAYGEAIMGGILMDGLFGGSFGLLGISVLYSAVFLLLVLAAFFLRSAMMEG